MAGEKFCENYPLWIVLVSNLVSISTYLIGAFIIYKIGPIWLAIYLLYILLLEIRLLKKSCVNCYYFGKTCAFGKGRLSSMLFRKGSLKFANRQITWKDIIPDFMVTIVPMVAAVGLLMMNFDWLLLVLLIALFLLGFAGSGFVRSQLACRYCKQRKLGCPAEKLFGKTRK
jgi:hypothetical protein